MFSSRTCSTKRSRVQGNPKRFEEAWGKLVNMVRTTSRWKMSFIRRALTTFWLLASLTWIAGVGSFIHPEHFNRQPALVWEAVLWQFSDCTNLSFDPGASEGDRKVSR